jgi:hypothetical protein
MSMNFWLHGVIFQKVVLLILIVVRSSNRTQAFFIATQLYTLNVLLA